MNFALLPVELELAILAQLPLSALPSLARVCRRWHAHLKHLDFIGSNADLRAIRARVAFLLHQHGDRTVCAYLDNSPLDGTPFARSSAPSARRDYRVHNFNDASKRLRRLLVLLREVAVLITVPRVIDHINDFVLLLHVNVLSFPGGFLYGTRI